MPGETFDFNDVVGPRDEANGYKVAPVIAEGELVDGIGGGTCQISGTLHGAAFFAGLEIVERYPHTRPSSYIKLGLDATVVYPTINFRMKNPFPFPVVLHQTVKNGVVRAEILGPRRTRTVTLIRRILEAIPYEEVERPDKTLPAGVRVLGQRGVAGLQAPSLPHRARGTARDARTLGRRVPADATDRARRHRRGLEVGEAPDDDPHAEYLADELLVVTQGPDTRDERAESRREGRRPRRHDVGKPRAGAVRGAGLDGEGRDAVLAQPGKTAPTGRKAENSPKEGRKGVAVRSAGLDSTDRLSEDRRPGTRGEGYPGTIAPSDTGWPVSERTMMTTTTEQPAVTARKPNEENGASARSADWENPRVASILSAAAKCFARKGFTATTLAEIGKELGLRKSIVHYYFASKAALIHEVQSFTYHRYLDRLKEAIRNGDGSPQQATDALRALWEAIQNNKTGTGLNIEVWSAARRDPELKRRAAGLQRDARQVVRDAIAGATKSGRAEGARHARARRAQRPERHRLPRGRRNQGQGSLRGVPRPAPARLRSAVERFLSSAEVALPLGPRASARAFFSSPRARVGDRRHGPARARLTRYAHAHRSGVARRRHRAEPALSAGAADETLPWLGATCGPGKTTCRSGGRF